MLKQNFQSRLGRECVCMFKKFLAGMALLFVFTTANAQISEDDFSQNRLADNLEQPMAMDVDPDGNIFIVGRCGRFYQWSSSTESVQQTSTVDVRCDRELGLIGIALDPNYEDNRWVYLHYNPDGESSQRVSRFEMNQNNSLDMGSEIVMLEFPVQTAECCHQGGDLEFGPDGNLFISVGDNVNPFSSDGFAPIDERSGRAPWDAQGTSGNTNDLRGKILRIRPNSNGSYSIPSGNLFAGNSQNRAEIYIMGNRNPFRIAIDEETGNLYWGEIGPDSNSSNNNRGPSGYDEINRATGPGNYGWPFVAGFNEPYNDYNFETENSGAVFDINGPTNTSPNNTGAELLPETEPAWIRFPHEAMMAGMVYHFDNSINNSERLPSSFDGQLIFWNFNNGDVFVVDANDNTPNETLIFNDINRNLIDMSLDNSDRLLALTFDRGSDGQLHRIEFNGEQEEQANQSPNVVASATPTEGSLPLVVEFSADGTTDPDGDALTFAWDFTTDGTVDSNALQPTHVYDETGQFNAQLRVTDSEGNSVVRNFTILAGISAPELAVTSPQNGSFFEYGDSVDFAVSLEDGDCSDVIVELVLSHISETPHVHGLSATTGCSGSFNTAEDSGHAGEQVFLEIVARYTNSDGITSTDNLELQPRRREGEHWTEQNGVVAEETTDTGGGFSAAFINNGDWLMFRDMNLINVDDISLRVASATQGGTIEARVGGVNGEVIGSVDVANTGGWQEFQTITMPLSAAASGLGENDLFFTFSGPGNSSLFNINWFNFNGEGSDSDGSNLRPAVSFIDPANGTDLDEPGNIRVEVEANDPDGDVSSVELFINDVFVRQENRAPYVWNNGGAQSLLSDLPSGSYTLRAVATDNEGATASSQRTFTVSAPTVSAGLPGDRIEAENFVAQSGIQTEATSDVGGGDNIGFIQQGDSSDYVLDVPADVTYDFSFRVASSINGGTISITLDGDVLASVDVPVTGGWQDWITVNTSADLPAGTNVYRLEYSGAASGYLLNVNWFEFVEGDGNPEIAIPGPIVLTQRIQAEDFTAQSGIFTESTLDTGGGENIGTINDGDSTSYSISVPVSGTYDVAFRVASQIAGTIALTQGGETLTTVDVPVTSGWQNWVTVETTADLSAGTDTYNLEFGGSTTSDMFNVNWFEFSVQNFNSVLQLTRLDSNPENLSSGTKSLSADADADGETATGSDAADEDAADETDNSSEPLVTVQSGASLQSSPTGNGECIEAGSINQLQQFLDQSNQCVQLKPGTYAFNTDNVGDSKLLSEPEILLFSGSNNTFIFDDVEFQFDTEIFRQFGGESIAELQVVGSDNVFRNLTMTDIGDAQPVDAVASIKVDGSNNLIEGFTVTTRGSYPYGYGDIFGSDESSKKHSGVVIGGDGNQLKGLDLQMNTYGHGIVVRGGDDVLIEDVTVEGELSTVGAVLAERNTGSYADEADFLTAWGHNLSELTDNYRFSLQEDGIRADSAGTVYGTDQQRDTGSITIRNCSVRFMRSGVSIGLANGEKLVENCTTEAVENGYWVGSNATVVNSRGDASVGPLLSEDAYSKGSTIELTLTDNVVPKIGNTPSLYLAGENHNLTLKDGTSVQQRNVQLLVGGKREGHRWLDGSGEKQPPQLDANGVTFDNQTPYPVTLGGNSKDANVTSCGPVRDSGSSNSVSSGANCN